MPAPRGLDVEQALAVLDTYNRQIEALTRQLNFLQAILNETRQARDSLEGLRREPSKELLVPVGANTFIYAEATRRDHVLSGIGAGLSLDRPVPEAEERLAKREEDIRAEMQRASEAVVRLQQEAATLQEQVEGDLEAARGPAMAVRDN